MNGERWKRSEWAMLAALVVLMIYHAATLGRIPAFPTDDDGAYAAAGHQFWLTSKPGVAGYKDVAGMGRDIYVLGHLGAAAQGLFMRVFGVGVSAALWPSWLMGCCLLGFVFLLGRALWDVRTGLMAALLLALSGVFFGAVHSARPDLMVTLFFVAALWLAASAPIERPSCRLALAGLVMSLAGDVHPNGFLLAPLPLVFWLLLRPATGRERWRALLIYGGAGAVGAAWWLARHYWPDPAAFNHQVALHGLATHGVKITQAGVFGALAAEADRYSTWFWKARGHRHLFEGLCIAGGALWLLWRGYRSERALIALWGGLFLIAAALMSNSFGWYLIFAWPLFALWTARALAVFPHQRWAAAMAMLMIAAYVGNLGLWHWKARQDVPLQARLLQLRQIVPPDAPVLASAGLWFAFWDRDFTHDAYLPFRVLESRMYPATSATGWEIEQRRRGWRYIAAYGNLRRALDPVVPIEEVIAVEPWRSRADEVREARAFSLKRCTVIARLPGQADAITVFRVNDEWSMRYGER